MAADGGCLGLCLGTTFLLHLSVSSGRPVGSVVGVAFVGSYIPVFFFLVPFKTKEPLRIKKKSSSSSSAVPGKNHLFFL